MLVLLCVVSVYMNVWLSSMLFVFSVIMWIIFRLLWMLELVRIFSLFLIVLVMVGNVCVVDSMLFSWCLLWLEIMMLLVLKCIVFCVFFVLRMFLIIIGLVQNLWIYFRFFQEMEGLKLLVSQLMQLVRLVGWLWQVEMLFRLWGWLSRFIFYVYCGWVVVCSMCCVGVWGLFMFECVLWQCVLGVGMFIVNISVVMFVVLVCFSVLCMKLWFLSMQSWNYMGWLMVGVIFLIGYIDIVDRVNGMLWLVVVFVVCILLWCVYMLVRLIGVSVIGIVSCLLNNLVFRFSLVMLCSMCWCRVMLVRLVILCLRVCLVYVLLLM